jgi:hypothetical protein
VPLKAAEGDVDRGPPLKAVKVKVLPLDAGPRGGPAVLIPAGVPTERRGCHVRRSMTASCRWRGSEPLSDGRAALLAVRTCTTAGVAV